MPFGMPISHIRVPYPILEYHIRVLGFMVPLPTFCCYTPWKATDNSLSIWVPPLLWEAQNDFLPPNFSWLEPYLLQELGNKQVDARYLSFSLAIYIHMYIYTYIMYIYYVYIYIHISLLLCLICLSFLVSPFK